VSEYTPIARFQSAIASANRNHVRSRTTPDDKIFTSVTWASPDTAKALAVVDQAIRDFAGRSFVGVDEVLDVVLDVRLALLSYLDDEDAG